MSDDNYSSDDMDEQYEIAFSAGRESRNEEIERLKAENSRLRDRRLYEVLDQPVRMSEWQIQLARIEQFQADRENLLQLLESASEVIGRFVSDEGWAQTDMDMMDTIDAKIASIRRAAQ